MPQRHLVQAKQLPRPANQQPQQINQQLKRIQQQQLRPKQQAQEASHQDQPKLLTTQRHSQQQQLRQEQNQPSRKEQQPQHQRQEQKQPTREEQKQQHQRQDRKQQQRQEEQKQQPQKQQQQQQRSQQLRQRQLRKLQQRQQRVATDDDTRGEETASPAPTPPPPPLRFLKEKANESTTETKDRSREPRQRLLQIKSNHRLETIDDYYAKLYCNNMLADVTLVVWHEGETVTLPAHRVILCNHSPYFAAIFEKVSPIVGLNAVVMILPMDVPLKVMELLLQFIYSGETSIPANMIDDVWRCAVQLKIRGFWSESRGESNEPLVSAPEPELDDGVSSVVQQKEKSDRSWNSGTKRARSRLEQMEEDSGQARKKARRQPSLPSDDDEFDKLDLIEVSSEVGFDLLRSDLDDDGDDIDEEEEEEDENEDGDEEDESDEEEDDDDDEDEDEDEDEDDDTDEDEDEDENVEMNKEDEEHATGEEDEARSIDELGHFGEQDHDDDDEADDNDNVEEEEEDSEESEEEHSEEDDEDEYGNVDDNNDDVEDAEVEQAVGDADELEPKEEKADQNLTIEQPRESPEIVQENEDELILSHNVKHEADLTPPPSFPNSPQEVGCEIKVDVNGSDSKRIETNASKTNGVPGDVGCQSNSAASRLLPVVNSVVQPSNQVRLNSSSLQTTQHRTVEARPSTIRGPLAVYRRRQYRSFTCKLCTLHFTMADNWLKHVEKVHARDTRKLNRVALQAQGQMSRSYCCDLCQKCLTSEFHWVQHVICQHTELYPHYFAESFGTPPER
ncbi:hypothetical protein AND_008919 [Anopheles darlingi]|uniref:BTB domain-containing protein n=1 Tax=Anopheles darlingi TaxID=43151 RepID=W5J9Q3_ANODA|nr:hypothetical protein AND_008919 [Anopheles darlingi]